MLQIGTLADAFYRKYASHGGGPVQLNVMACLPNALYLETGLIHEGSPLQLVDGCALVPQGAGYLLEVTGPDPELKALADVLQLVLQVGLFLRQAVLHTLQFGAPFAALGIAAIVIAADQR